MQFIGLIAGHVATAILCLTFARLRCLYFARANNVAPDVPTWASYGIPSYMESGSRTGFYRNVS